MRQCGAVRQEGTGLGAASDELEHGAAQHLRAEEEDEALQPQDQDVVAVTCVVAAAQRVTIYFEIVIR